jgi:hypothetical protein
MHTELEAHRSRPPILKRVFAGVILVVAAALAVNIVIGLVMTIFWIALGVAVVLAILWALKTLVW